MPGVRGEKFLVAGVVEVEEVEVDPFRVRRDEKGERVVEEWVVVVETGR